MTFSEQFIQVMDEVFKRVGIMVDWTSQNVMPHLADFAERFIQYQIFTNAIIAISLVVAFIVCLILTIVGNKRSWDLRVFLFGMATVSLGIVCVGALPYLIHNIIQAVFIPEMTIIKELMTLIQ